MKKTVTIIIAVFCVLVATLSVVAYKNGSLQKTPKEISYITNDSSINTNDPRKVVGIKTYVFVGLVEDTYDYFQTKQSHDFPQVIKDYEHMAFTECVVKAVKNIKGNLKEGESFSFYKVGGTSMDGKTIELCENDLIPEKGKYYIFTGIAHKDGTLTGGGENGTIALENEINADNLADSQVYNKYVKAYEEQKTFENSTNVPYLAKNDVNYKNGEYNLSLFEKVQEEKEKVSNEVAVEVTGTTN